MAPVRVLRQFVIVVGGRMQRRTQLGWGLIVVMGCAGGEPLERPSDDPEAWAGPERSTEGEDGSGDTDGATSVASANPGGQGDGATTTSGGMGRDGGGMPTGPVPPPMDDTMDGTFGEDGGEQPAVGPYSPCMNGTCVAGLVCLDSSVNDQNMCVEFCSPPGDPSGCAPAPGGDSTPTCLAVDGFSFCALDCSSGRSCPTGMACHDEPDDLGPQMVCL